MYSISASFKTLSMAWLISQSLKIPVTSSSPATKTKLRTWVKQSCSAYSILSINLAADQTEPETSHRVTILVLRIGRLR